MSTFTFNCPHCNSELEAQNEWAGLQMECPSCNQTITVIKKEKAITLQSMDKTAENLVPTKKSFRNLLHGITKEMKIGVIAGTVTGGLAIGIMIGTLFLSFIGASISATISGLGVTTNSEVLDGLAVYRIGFRKAVNLKVAKDLHEKTENSWGKLIDSGHFDHLSYNDMVKHIGKEEADKRQKIKNNK